MFFFYPFCITGLISLLLVHILKVSAFSQNLLFAELEFIDAISGFISIVQYLQSAVLGWILDSKSHWIVSV